MDVNDYNLFFFRFSDNTADPGWRKSRIECKGLMAKNLKLLKVLAEIIVSQKTKCYTFTILFRNKIAPYMDDSRISFQPNGAPSQYSGIF